MQKFYTDWYGFQLYTLTQDDNELQGDPRVVMFEFDQITITRGNTCMANTNL